MDGGGGRRAVRLAGLFLIVALAAHGCRGGKSVQVVDDGIRVADDFARNFGHASDIQLPPSVLDDMSRTLDRPRPNLKALLDGIDEGVVTSAPISGRIQALRERSEVAHDVACQVWKLVHDGRVDPRELVNAYRQAVAGLGAIVDVIEAAARLAEALQNGIIEGDEAGLLAMEISCVLP